MFGKQIVSHYIHVCRSGPNLKYEPDRSANGELRRKIVKRRLLVRPGLKLCLCTFLTCALTSAAFALPKKQSGTCGCACISSDGAGTTMTTFNNYASNGYPCSLLENTVCSNVDPYGQLQSGRVQYCTSSPYDLAHIAISQSPFGPITVFRIKRPRH